MGIIYIALSPIYLIQMLMINFETDVDNVYQ